MNDATLAARLAAHEATLAAEVKRDYPQPPLGSPTLLALTTTIQTYPTSAQSYFACRPLILLGNEIEGGPGSVTPGNATFFALNLGSTIPPSGTQVLVTFVGNRWVFRYDA